MIEKSGILDKDEVRNLLSEVVEKYREVIQDKLVEIILFGSYARENQEQYSDIDIMVLIDDSDENLKKFDKLLENINFELTMRYEILVSPVLIKLNIFKAYRDCLPFYINLLKDGVILYERQAA